MADKSFLQNKKRFIASHNYQNVYQIRNLLHGTIYGEMGITEHSNLL